MAAGDVASSQRDDARFVEPNSKRQCIESRDVRVSYTIYIVYSPHVLVDAWLAPAVHVLSYLR